MASNYAVDLTHIPVRRCAGRLDHRPVGDAGVGAGGAGGDRGLLQGVPGADLFDPVLALALRLPATALRYLLLGVIALTVVTSLQTVGIALVLAMLVTPAATAQLLTRRLPPMMMVAVRCSGSLPT